MIAPRYNCEFFSVTVKRKLSTPARVQIHVDPGVDVRHFRRNNRKNASHQHLGLHGPGEHRAEEGETKSNGRR